MATSRHVGMPSADVEVRCFVKDCERQGRMGDIVKFMKTRNLDGKPIDASAIVGSALLYRNTIEIWIPKDKLNPPRGKTGRPPRN